MNENEKKDKAAQDEQAGAEKDEHTDTNEQPDAGEKDTGEKSVGEILADDRKDDQGNKVPESVFLAEKKGRKEAERKAKSLEAELEALRKKNGGEGDSIPAGDIASLAMEHNVDPDFLQKLAGALEAKAEAAVRARLAPLEEQEKARRMNEAFTAGFKRAIEQMPEYKGIVNPEVIRTLSLDPKNAKKTFSQLIEETYGGAIPNKRPIDAARPGSRDTGEIDHDRARKDSEYFNSIMANPAAKKKYNDELTARIGKYL